MSGINQVILIGNLTRDPDMKYTQNQVAVTSFSVAVNEKWTDQAGNVREEVCFVECNAWKRTAEIVSQYCKKGTKVGIVGKLKFDQWTAQDGSNRSKITVTVKQVELLGGAPQNGPGHHDHYQKNQQPAPATAPQQQMLSPDDIPF